MSTLEATFPESIRADFFAPTLPLLNQVPSLLEYRSESDPDGDFILKTIAGFGAGLLAMFFCFDLGARLLVNRATPLADQATSIMINAAAMFGIAAVAASLLLVGLKVRADHSDEPLFARHWLNSISTGALYSMMIWFPLTQMSTLLHLNRFIISGIFMLLLAFPALAAKWVIAPHPHYTPPAK